MGRNDRQPNIKSRSFSKFTLHLDAPIMLLHNTITNGKAEASALPNCFGCKKWLKNTALRFGIHSFPIIGDRYFYFLTDFFRFNFNYSLFLNGLNGIVDNIEKYLIEAADLANDWGQFSKLRTYFNARGYVAFEQGNGTFYTFI